MRTKHCSGYLGARPKETALSKSYIMQPKSTEQNIALVTLEHVPKKQHTPYTREQNIALVTLEDVPIKQRYQILLNATIH